MPSMRATRIGRSIPAKGALLMKRLTLFAALVTIS